MTAEVLIACNGCDRTSHIYVGSAQFLRQRLVSDGWHHGAGGLDWCPDCWAAGRQRADSTPTPSTDTPTTPLHQAKPTERP